MGSSSNNWLENTVGTLFYAGLIIFIMYVMVHSVANKTVEVLLETEYRTLAASIAYQEEMVGAQVVTEVRDYLTKGEGMPAFKVYCKSLRGVTPKNADYGITGGASANSKSKQ